MLSVLFYFTVDRASSFGKKVMSPKNPEKTILVTGGTGKTGRRVIKRLEQLKWPLRVGSRSGKPPFDWRDAATWKPALEGMDAVYIAFQPDLAVPGAVDIIQRFTKTAAAAGVKKLVLLSGRGEKEAEECEQVVMKAGLDWTILRASWFCQNFSEGAFLEAIQAGHLALPAGDIGEPFIDADDIADVAVAALTEEGHNSQLYELTGPRLLSFKEAAREISNATGKAIQYEQVPAAAYTEVLGSYGLPEDVIWLVNYLFTEVLDGRNASLKDGVQRALGRKPIDFSVYVQKAAATGIWD
jgi:uncharacterized protein YbjT (DUF2867 family)